VLEDADSATRPESSESSAERRMSASEALMWRIEKDPFLSSTFGSVSIFERPVDFGRLRERMERAIPAFPRLGWRVQPNPADLGTPVWADDPDFDIDVHVRHVALPKPGTRAQLFDLANRFILDPLDRTRPLWQFLVVDGLRGGKGAVVQKMHHTISDGINAIRMSMQYLDFDPDATAPVGGFVEEHDIAPPPSSAPIDVVRGFVEGSFRLPLSIARQVGELLAEPASIPKAGSAVFDTVRTLASQLSDTEAARSPLWRQRSLRREIVTASAPFRPTKAAAKKLGGTINTAFLTTVAEAASRYHLEFGEPVDALRASMAVSTRTDDSGANAFSLVRMLVPTGEMSLGERFEAISAAVDGARQGSASANLETLATVATALPTSLLTRLARQQAQTVDFATSNVRGAPVSMYVAGAKLLENYPVGPLVGVAFNITMLSYDGRLNMGINVDNAAVDEPARLGRLVEQSARDLAKTR
jgi:WS/DGAT/MGAT family acyltransferase